MTEIPNIYPVRIRRQLNDPFFEEGNKFCFYGKIAHISENSDENFDLLDEPIRQNLTNNDGEFQCRISGCLATFVSTESYVSHYNSSHKHVCCTCRRVFPNSRLLEIHVSEWHDSFFQLQAQKQNSFQCFVESCGEKFIDSKLRHKHLVSVHAYPSDFRYDKPPANKSTKPSDSEAMQIDETESSTIETKKIPSTVCFGSGSRRGFNRRRNQIKSTHLPF